MPVLPEDLVESLERCVLDPNDLLLVGYSQNQNYCLILECVITHQNIPTLQSRHGRYRGHGYFLKQWSRSLLDNPGLSGP